jgi:hypothetical protein
LAWNFWPLAIPMAAFCAWLHVSGVAFPLLFMWTPFWWVVPVGGGLAFLFGKDKIKAKIASRKKDFNADNENHEITWRKSILYVKTIGYHFCNCVLPLNPAMYHDFLYYFGGTEEGNKNGYAINGDFWKGAVVVTLLAYLIIFQHSFWAFWFVLFISQWCNVYQVTMSASDRYCSIANVGVMCLLAEWILKLPDPYRTVAVCGLGAVYVVKYQPLFMAYRSVENFWQYHIFMVPNIIGPRYFLYKYFIAKKEVFQAIGVLRQGLRYRPTDFKLLLGMMECLFAIGQIKRALRMTDYIEKHVPLGEEILTRNLLNGIRAQFAKEYGDLHKVVIHNNGKPFVKIKPSDN